jgi:hypothetical protein
MKHTKYSQISLSRKTTIKKEDSRVGLHSQAHRMANTLVIIIRKHTVINRMQIIGIIEGINPNKDGKIEILEINLCMISIERSRESIIEVLTKLKRQDSSVNFERD